MTQGDLETIIHGVGRGHSKQALNYVRVEPGMLVATDGHILIVREVSHDGGKFKPFCVSVDDVKGALRANAELWRTNGKSVKLDPGDDFMARIGCKTVAKQDASYPDWGRLIVKKDKRGHQVAKFDPTKLMKVLQAMRDIECVEFRIWGTDEAARLDGVNASGRKVMALVMPLINR